MLKLVGIRPLQKINKKSCEDQWNKQYINAFESRSFIHICECKLEFVQTFLIRSKYNLDTDKGTVRGKGCTASSFLHRKHVQTMGLAAVPPGRPLPNCFGPWSGQPHRGQALGLGLSSTSVKVNNDMQTLK